MKPASIRFERNQVVRISGPQLRIGDMEVDDTQRVRLKGLRTPLSGSHIRLAASHFHTLAPGGNPPQLSLVAFNLTGEPGALEHYFPLAQGLPPKRRAEFHQVLDRLVAMDQLRITLSGEGKRDRTRALPAGVRHLLAGLILEPLFFRQDLLGAFFTRRKVFKLYTTLQALRDDGGVGGGCYHPGRRIMQLALPRLWEGFDQSLPGVSPFLHEFGHMLDAFDERRLRLDRLDGFLPGMDESASAAFIEGKAIELERYRTSHNPTRRDNLWEILMSLPMIASSWRGISRCSFATRTPLPAATRPCTAHSQGPFARTRGIG